MENQFELLFQCYISGQMTEKQWQTHLKEDKGLKEWYSNFKDEKRELAKEKLPQMF